MLASQAAANLINLSRLFFFLFFFGGGGGGNRKIVKIILRGKNEKKVPSRPLHNHSAAGPETIFFLRLA